MTSAKAPMRSGPRPGNHVIVLFGATGDLAKRKLLPGLFHLAAAGLMPEKYRIIGSAPAQFALSTEAFREHARQAAEQFGTSQAGGRGLGRVRREPVVRPPRIRARPARWPARSRRRRRRSAARRAACSTSRSRPSAFESVVAMIGAMDLAAGSRVIIEKPFGTDLASARDLNAKLHQVFDESQIFRIDHFLGKESVDNILALRFANGLFEPNWNRDHIRYVQIDVPETLSIEGRADFYDKTGAYRDMVVTHLFQALGFIAMEEPSSLDAKSLRAEKAKVYDALKPIDCGTSCAASTRATAASPACRRTPRRRPWSRCGPRSRTGAGRASRSSCGRGRTWGPAGKW